VGVAHGSNPNSHGRTLVALAPHDGLASGSWQSQGTHDVAPRHVVKLATTASAEVSAIQVATRAQPRQICTTLPRSAHIPRGQSCVESHLPSSSLPSASNKSTTSPDLHNTPEISTHPPRSELCREPSPEFQLAISQQQQQQPRQICTTLPSSTHFTRGQSCRDSHLPSSS
jgi:hypothetical protein